MKREAKDVPQIPRTVDPKTGKATISGADALAGASALYDFAGDVLGQLNALIDAVTAREGEGQPKP